MKTVADLAELLSSEKALTRILSNELERTGDAAGWQGEESALDAVLRMRREHSEELAALRAELEAARKELAFFQRHRAAA
jgi:hypothetical protein